MTADARSPVWSALGSVLRRRRRRLAAFTGWSLLEATPALLSGHLVATAIDDGFLAGQAGTGFGWLAVLAAAVLVGAVATRQTYLHLAAVVEPFRDELAGMAVTGTVRRSLRAGAPPDTAGVARLTNQVDVVRETFAGTIMTAQGFIVVSTAALVGLATLLPAALLLVVPPLLVGLVMFFSALPALAARQRDLVLAEERIAATAYTLSHGMRDVVTCGAEDQLAEQAGQDVEAHAAAAAALARLAAVRSAALVVGSRLPLVLILIGVPWLLDHGATAGIVLGALTYVLQGLQPAMQTLVRVVGVSAISMVVNWRRLLDAAAADEPTALTEHPATGTGAVGHRGSGLELRGVHFAYGPDAEPVLRDLDLRIPDGDHLAVVGPSGVGKSTLAGVLAGLLQPDTGDARLDGVPLSDWDRTRLAARRVLIPQEAYVFADTLRENLGYLRGNVDDAELDDAVNALGLRPVVKRLGGYSEPVVPAELSAGERQLVTLVRAYVSRAPLVILDEATCHLDPAAEERVERVFAARPGTLVVIAHRISSAQRAHRILLLDGEQAVLGSHRDLQDVSASYRDLVGHWTPERHPAPDPVSPPIHF